jgi:hypothetical protein
MCCKKCSPIISDWVSKKKKKQKLQPVTGKGREEGRTLDPVGSLRYGPGEEVWHERSSL